MDLAETMGILPVDGANLLKGVGVRSKPQGGSVHSMEDFDEA